MIVGISVPNIERVWLKVLSINPVIILLYYTEKVQQIRVQLNNHANNLWVDFVGSRWITAKLSIEDEKKNKRGILKRIA